MAAEVDGPVRREVPAIVIYAVTCVSIACEFKAAARVLLTPSKPTERWKHMADIYDNRLLGLLREGVLIETSSLASGKLNSNPALKLAPIVTYFGDIWGGSVSS